MKQNILKLVESLTPSQRAALRPLTPFSDSDGAVLVEKGMLTEKDGVWTHTRLGMKAYAEVIARGLA